MLLGWFAGQTVELSIAGIVVGIGLNNERLRRLFFQVLGFVIGLIVLSIIMQNIG